MHGAPVSESGVIGDVRQLPPKTYLGDAVYARIDEFNAVILTTENGYRATNVITLEPEVMAALLAWHKRAMGESLPVVETKDYCRACANGKCDEHPQYNACVACAIERKQRAAVAERKRSLDAALGRDEPVRVTIDICPVHSITTEETIVVERIPLCANCSVVPGWGECSSRFCYGCCADAKHECDKTCSDDPPARSL